MSSRKLTPLFGGALVAEIPDNFADVRYDKRNPLPTRARLYFVVLHMDNRLGASVAQPY